MDVERKRTISVKLFNKNRIDLHKEIGSGSFGKVLKGVCAPFSRFFELIMHAKICGDAMTGRNMDLII